MDKRFKIWLPRLMVGAAAIIAFFFGRSTYRFLITTGRPSPFPIRLITAKGRSSTR